MKIHSEPSKKDYENEEEKQITFAACHVWNEISFNGETANLLILLISSLYDETCK